MFSSMRSRVIAAGVAAVVIGAGSYGIVAANASSASPAASSSTPGTHASAPAGGFGSGGQGSNARSGPAAGGTAGTVSSVTSAGFTVETPAGEKATVTEASSTTYQKGSSPATASAVTAGEPVLVLGTTDNTTITATQVIVQPPATSASNPGGQVIPYSKGQRGSTQQVGQIPAGYSQGTGTIVSGTAAAKATEAALAAYPGGIVDRVVAIGGGDYEVHYIGVNWPHHIFVNQDFQVIGAND
jgi:membrane-bound inhibitor of C-type lysozyme